MVVKELLFNPDFRKNFRSLMKTKKILVYWGWGVLEDLGLIESLKSGMTYSELIRKAKIKNEPLFRNLLQLLVSQKIVCQKGSKYFLVSKPKRPNKKDFQFLLYHCPSSTRWAFSLKKELKKSLLKNKRYSNLDFEAEPALWDLMMRESVDTLRALAIKKAYSILKKKKEINILILGVGSGRDIEQIVSIFSGFKKINVDGVDISQQMLNLARKTVKSIPSELSENLHVKLINKDILDFKTDKKYDLVFSSLVLHHISPENRQKLYENLKGIMKDDGIMVIHQIVHRSRESPNFIYLMHMMPSHKDYPIYSEFKKELSQHFSKVKSYYKGSVWVCYN